jgi:hypothetical protein
VVACCKILSQNSHLQKRIVKISCDFVRYSKSFSPEYVRWTSYAIVILLIIIILLKLQLIMLKAKTIYNEIIY